MMKPLVNLVKRTLLLILATSCGGVEVDFARSLAVRAPADIVLRSGKVITLDKEFSIREAVAIKDGRFLAVGSDREVRPLVGPGTRVIELAGRTVIPGLVDARIHATEACVQWNTQLHWQSTRTLVDALNQVAAAARTRPRGAWIVVGGGWVPTQFAERRFPTRAELDARAPDHPVYIQYLDEAALLNSAALRALQFASARPFISEGKIERHPKTGELTGWIQGAAWRLALDEIPQPTLDVARQSLRDCFRELLRFGITSIGDVQSSSVTFAHRRLLADLARAGELHPRVNFYVATSDAAGELDRLKLILEQIKTLGSHERIRFAGFSWSNGGAAAREPEFRRAVAFFAENGFNFQVHANGDQAIRPLVAALQEIHKVQPGMRRRIVFAGLDDVSPETAEQIKALGGWFGVAGQHGSFRGTKS